MRIFIATLGFLIIIGVFLFFFIERTENKKVFTLLEKGKSIESLKYDLLMERPERITEGTFWQREEDIRMEVVFEGKKTIYLGDIEIVHVYIPGESFIAKINFDEADKVQRGSLKEYIKRALNSKPVITGEDVLDGKECFLVEYISEKGKE